MQNNNDIINLEKGLNTGTTDLKDIDEYKTTTTTTTTKNGFIDDKAGDIEVAETTTPESTEEIVTDDPAIPKGKGGKILSTIFSYARKFHIEERGIERVPEDQRSNQTFFDGFTMWASANFTYVYHTIFPNTNIQDMLTL